MNVKLTAKYYRMLVMELGSKTAPVVTLDKYISKIANLAKLEVRVERLAAEIAEKTQDHTLADGKAPNGLAAAYLYIASTLLGQSILQRDVSSIAGITEVTIRNRCKEILTVYKMKVTLRPLLDKLSISYIVITAFTILPLSTCNLVSPKYPSTLVIGNSFIVISPPFASSDTLNCVGIKNCVDFSDAFFKAPCHPL